MSIAALGLLLLAAALHTGWNLLVKNAKEKQVFTWLALMVGSLAFSPLLIASLPVPSLLWPYVICSAVMEALYFLVLIQAYQIGDFSLMYPLARGTAPAFLAIWAILFLGERPGVIGLAGIALLISGLIIVGGKSWSSFRKLATLKASGLGLAVFVALCISIYSVIDAAAIRHFAPLPYTVLVIGATALMISPLIFVRYGYQAVKSEWNSNWLRITVVGILSLLAYMLVLQAYSISRVSYAGAIREISVVFAALVGWRWLGEKMGVTRTIGACFIFAGILVIALAG